MKAVLEREKAALASDASQLAQIQQDDEEDEMLELASLDLDDPDWMKHVSAKTLAKFNALIMGGALDSAFHQWVPWWLRDKLSPKIEEIPSETANEDEESENENDENATGQPEPSPPICADIPKLADLTKVSPSPLIAFNVIEVIFCYVYVKQLYNGDWDEENADEALEAVITLSSVLRENQVYKSAMDAIRRPIEQSRNSREISGSPAFSLACIRDTLTLVSKGHLFMLAALSELREVFSTCISKHTLAPPPKPAKQNKKVPTPSQMQMKIAFFISWTNERAQEVIPELEIGLRSAVAEYERYENKPAPVEEEHDKIATMVQEPKKETKEPKKPLIEEIP